MRRLVTQRRAPNRRSLAVEKTFPAPVGGWNSRDSLAAMDKLDAVKLINWYPRPSFVEMRGGYEAFATNMQSDIKTMATLVKSDGFSILLAFFDTGIAFATYAGDYSGNPVSFDGIRTEGRHQWEQFGDGTNTWLIAVNGVDKPFYYNGTSYVLVDGVSTPAITGLTTTDIVSLAVFKNRILFIRNDKLGFDYLPAGAAGGAATYYDLSSFASKGGYLQAIAVWTRDAGSGPDDYAVFLTSEGQALVYSGTDPSSANTWALVGTFQIGRPLGRKCVAKFGADPLILTENGLFPLSALLASGDERQKFAISFKIQDAFSEAAKLYFNNIGWQVISYPKEDAIIVNVPIAEDGRHDQFVMNTISKSWCRFTGWNAEEFILHKAEQVTGPSDESFLMFSKGRQVFKAWVGTSDNGAAITYEGLQAFQDYGYQQIKEPLMYMPVMTAASLDTFQAGVETDFEERSSTTSSTVQTTGALKWGIGKWGTSQWARGSSVIRQWSGIASWPGRWLAGKMKVTSSSAAARWIGSVIRFKLGNGI